MLTVTDVEPDIDEDPETDTVPETDTDALNETDPVVVIVADTDDVGDTDEDTLDVPTLKSELHGASPPLFFNSVAFIPVKRDTQQHRKITE